MNFSGDEELCMEIQNRVLLQLITVEEKQRTITIQNLVAANRVKEVNLAVNLPILLP